MNKEQKTSQTTEPAIAVDTVLAPVVWGVNKFGQEVKEHDKLSCGNGYDTWFTHVMFDTERNCWHREQDYYHSKVVGSYNGCQLVSIRNTLNPQRLWDKRNRTKDN